MDYGSHCLLGYPHPGTEPQPLLLLEPMVSSQSLLMAQEWGGDGTVFCPTDAFLPWGMGTPGLSEL